jgi:uncharacterized membrane protein (UPF0127 family)
MRVLNRSKQTVLAEQARIASTPWARLVGLLAQKGIEPGGGLLLRGEQAIHTFGMRFAIDIVYLDSHHRVLRALTSLPPNRLGPFLRRSRDVLELPVGTLAITKTEEGDLLELNPE